MSVITARNEDTKALTTQLQHFSIINLDTTKEFNKIRVSATQIHLLYYVSSVTIGIFYSTYTQVSQSLVPVLSKNDSHDENKDELLYYDV